MTPILFASAIHVVFGILMSVTAVFLMLIVLVQRGRGGGLAGAFGGAGGQSAFGTKAGDLFTRITIGVAIFWVLLCLVALKVLGTTSSRFGTVEAPASEGLIAPAGSSEDDAAPPADGLGAGPGETTGDDAGAPPSESTDGAAAASPSTTGEPGGGDSGSAGTTPAAGDENQD